tara:strand:+ start:750 stop:1238 length:489 start_codon:yes stop_codon:yes gene_type:complete
MFDKRTTVVLISIMAFSAVYVSMMDTGSYTGQQVALGGNMTNTTPSYIYDLATISLSVNVTNSTNSTNSTNIGVWLYATVKNVGPNATPMTVTRLATNPSGSIVGQNFNTPSLAPGQTYSVSHYFVPIAHGFHHAIALADYTNVVQERNERNNIKKKTYHLN